MPSKPKMTASEYEAKLKDWATRLWTAISNEGRYSDHHDGLYKEFNELRDENRGNSAWMSLINHVAPIYDHIASQGYKAQIHYKPLREAVNNYCEGKSVFHWKGPPDQFSRSPSPVLPASSGRQTPHSENDDESEKERPKAEAVKTRKAPTVVTKPAEGADSKSLPSTEGMDKCPTKCAKCSSRKHGCHVNPKATKPGAACFECNHWRLKCSISTIRGNAAKKGEDEEEGPSLPTAAPAPRRRYTKKPIPVPAAQPAPQPAPSTGEHIFINL